MAERRNLQFDSPETLIADVQRLRRGYTRAGNWSLEQACWHLGTIARLLTAPGAHPETTPEQHSRRPLFEQIMATGKLPSGISAPEPVTPPAECSQADVDGFIAAVEAFYAHPGPYAPHRLFGNLSVDEMQRLQLIHAAHHLSYLVPNE